MLPSSTDPQWGSSIICSLHLDTVIIPKLKELRTSPILMNRTVSQGTVNHARVCYLCVSMLKYLLTFHGRRQIIIRSNSSKTFYNTNNCRCCRPNLLLLYSVDKQVWCHNEISVTTEPIFVFVVLYSKTTQSLGIIISFILRLIKRQKHIPWNSNNPGDDCTFDRYVLTIWDTNDNIAILVLPDVIMC